jgi:hypothetical protein
VSTHFIPRPSVMAELYSVSYRGLVANQYEKSGNVDTDVNSEVEFARRFSLVTIFDCFSLRRPRWWKLCARFHPLGLV